MTGNLPVVPSRESLSASNRQASSSTVRNGVSGRFFSNSNVRPATVEPFERQASQVQQSIQRDNHFTPVRSGEQLNARNETPGSVRSSGSTRPSVSDISAVNSRGLDGKPSAGIRPETSGSTNQRETNANGGNNRFGSPQAQSSQPTRNEPAASEPHNTNNVPRPGQNNQPQSSRPANSDQSGWHRFSDSGNAGSGNARGSVRPDTSSPRSVPRPPSSSNPASERSITRTNPATRSPQSNYGGGNGDYRPFSSAPRSSAPSNSYPRNSGPNNSYPRNFGSSNSYHRGEHRRGAAGRRGVVAFSPGELGPHERDPAIGVHVAAARRHGPLHLSHSRARPVEVASPRVDDREPGRAPFVAVRQGSRHEVVDTDAPGGRRVHGARLRSCARRRACAAAHERSQLRGLSAKARHHLGGENGASEVAVRRTGRLSARPRARAGSNAWPDRYLAAAQPLETVAPDADREHAHLALGDRRALGVGRSMTLEKRSRHRVFQSRDRWRCSFTASDGRIVEIRQEHHDKEHECLGRRVPSGPTHQSYSNRCISRS